MKTTLILLVLAAATFSSNAQTMKADEVPAAIKTKVSSLYPNAKVEKWEKEEGNFEAELEINKVETSVLIDPTGNLLETETEIETSALPKGVADYAAKNLPGKKIAEASKIVDAKGAISFEAEIGKADYIFDSNGNFVKKIAEAKDEDDEKEKNK